MPEKPGVLVLTPFYEPNVGGVETHLKDLTEYLKGNTSKVFVLTYQPITTKARGAYLETSGNVEIIRIPWIGFNLFHKLEPYPILEFIYITPWLFFWTFIFLLFKGRKVAVVHAQGFNAAFIARLLKKIFNKRLIVSTHAVYEMTPNSLMAQIVSWTLKGADKILTLSNASKKELTNIGIDKDKIEIFTYWVDQEIFKPIDKTLAKNRVGWNDLFVVLFVGRFIELKGTDILLALAEETREKLHFAFIGDGPLAEDIKKRADMMENVVYIGKIDNRELPLYYSAADILCVPSKYEEGFGRVILEALSCGTPVIASNKGGIPEAIDDSVGILVEPTTGSFYRAILSLYEDREKLESRRRSCRNYAVKRFGTSNAETILNSYSC